jgi:hypothetical protein
LDEEPPQGAAGGPGCRVTALCFPPIRIGQRRSACRQCLWIGGSPHIRLGALRAARLCDMARWRVSLRSADRLAGPSQVPAAIRSRTRLPATIGLRFALHDRQRAPLKAKPDTTLTELRDGLGLPVALSTLWYHVDRLGLTFKKPCAPLNRPARRCVSSARSGRGLQALWDPVHRVFVDDTGLNTVMVRLYGWGPCGERVPGALPHGHWETSTWVLAVRQAGLAAPMVTAGADDWDLVLGRCENISLSHFVAGRHRHLG